MKVAIISDVHANIHALEAVWVDLEKAQPEAVYCLGDLVGYGAFPNEVVEFLQAREVPTVMGNYDEGVGFDLEDCGCAYKDEQAAQMGQESLLWSREHTSSVNKRFLQELRSAIRLDETAPQMLLVHGSPRKMNEYLYEDRPQATFARIARVAGAKALIFGHTHIPYQKHVMGTLFINAGSVGKPHDGDPRAGYVLLERRQDLKAEIRRVAYDVTAAAQAIRETALPDRYADLLESGGVG